MGPDPNTWQILRKWWKNTRDQLLTDTNTINPIYWDRFQSWCVQWTIYWNYTMHLEVSLIFHNTFILHQNRYSRTLFSRIFSQFSGWWRPESVQNKWILEYFTRAIHGLVYTGYGSLAVLQNNRNNIVSNQTMKSDRRQEASSNQFSSIFSFVSDRLRSVRQDMVMQNLDGKSTVILMEVGQEISPAV